MKKMLAAIPLVIILIGFSFTGASAQNTKKFPNKNINVEQGNGAYGELQELAQHGQQIYAALEEGLSQYKYAQKAAAKGRMELNENEQKIKKQIEETLPAIYNKIEKSSSEVVEELFAAYSNLAKLLLVEADSKIKLETEEEKEMAIVCLLANEQITSKIESLIKPKVIQILEAEKKQLIEKKKEELNNTLQELFGF